jgi:transcriptional regulator with XRE-family HTH domain
MGAMVGVGQRAVASWEQGRKRPGVDTYLELATALNVDPGWLAFGIESVGGRVVDKPNPNTVPMLGTANAKERPATEVLHVPTAADIRARQEAAKKKGKKA